MVQFTILSGSRSGTVQAVRRFPFSIGRSPSAGLRIEDAGVWEKHLEVRLDRPEGFFLSVHPSAIASVNGQPASETVRLRNGDLIEIGSVKMRFWLGETKQRGQRWIEWLTWAGLLLLCAGQVWLIYLLSR